MKVLTEAKKGNEIKPPAVTQKLSGPVVIWNLIRRCNLACKHCYTSSGDVNYPDELTTEQAYKVIDDLKEYGVKVLILSGGEPLLRDDIYDISRRAKDLGFYVGLSTNGTKITEENIGIIKDIGYDYVGISLDGLNETHDHFRRKEGAFKEALNGIRLCKKHNIKVGIRYCLTQDTQDDLPKMLEFVEQENIDKFYMSHLNYSGRGYSNRKRDALHQTTRKGMDLIFKYAWDQAETNSHREVVTGNNDADGAYFLMWTKENHPEHYDLIEKKLQRWGGNSTGVNISNIDNTGNVHPDSFWWNYTLGNVLDRPFSEIWSDTSEPMIKAMRQNPRQIKGRCDGCGYFGICNGNTRVRAYNLSGDFLQEDPGCYLTDTEISRRN